MFEFIERLALGFGNEAGNQEIQDAIRRKEEEHRIPAPAVDPGEERRGEAPGRQLVHEERDGHAVRANAHRHQLRENQPHADARSERIEDLHHEERDETDAARDWRRGDAALLDRKKHRTDRKETDRHAGRADLQEPRTPLPVATPRRES